MIPPVVLRVIRHCRLLTVRIRAIGDIWRYGPVSITDLLDAWDDSDRYEQIATEFAQRCVAYAAALTGPLDSALATVAVADITAEAARWLTEHNTDASEALITHADHVLDCDDPDHAHDPNATRDAAPHGGLLDAAAAAGKVVVVDQAHNLFDAGCARRATNDSTPIVGAICTPCALAAA